MAADKTETREARALLLQDVLERRALYSVFQPIYHFKTGRILGYEALIRGPKGSTLQSPLDLFSAAQDEGSLLQLSIICIQTVLRSFAALRVPGKLFLNVSPRVVTLQGFSQDRARQFLNSIDIKPERVIIELTEQESGGDFTHIHSSLMLYRSMGFQVAIDDLGEGFSSLRLWSELRPEYVKADKHFVHGISQDPVKLQFLRAMQMIAETCGSSIIAEGIESALDFKLVQEVGIACGQGYFIGVPAERPQTELPQQVLDALKDPRKPVLPIAKFRDGVPITAKYFMRHAETVAVSEPVERAIALFASTPNRYAIPVLDGRMPVGLIARRHVRAIKTPDGVQAELRDHPCREIMNVAPLVVDGTLSINQLSTLLAEATPQHLADGFIITAEGKYLGMGSANDVLRVLNERNQVAARYTNPLSLLPGQVPTNEHLQRLLSAEHRFIACQAELEPMKGFNDMHGFAQGDELIRVAGTVLRDAGDPMLDFVGHVYGNRFVILMQSDDWQARLERALQEFAAALKVMLSAEDFQRGSFIWKGRAGRTEMRPIPRLAIGAVLVEGERWESRHDVMAAARDAESKAKSLAGSNLTLHEPGPAQPTAH